ncbi:MAG: alpha-L-fucosidase [Alistipes sp.]|nr:alpha-L-fucosidase [Alistipes sp.]
MKRSLVTLALGLLCASCAPKHETMKEGPYQPTWESLSQYGQAPDWFRDVKFGIWSHWGPQCQPEQGDWYARQMYLEGSRANRWHVENYGHPSEFGFKEVINLWKAENWNPEELMELYRRVGARYFFTLGNHHDNFDNWDSRHHAWNAVNLGPKRDIIGDWERAARARGMRFGVSIHSAHAWTWYEPSQRSDREGPMAGVPYDGKMTADQGKGLWWDGYDPQELYAQNHPLSERSAEDNNAIHRQWAWGGGACPPSEEFTQNFFDRNVDMMNRYNPDLVYYDDTSMPLWPVSDAGLRAVAHLYNKSVAENDGQNQAVVFAKILTDEQKNALVWDVEMGVPDAIQPKPWQTCTCLGSWHYDRSIYERDRYKSARTVVHMLIDIVSKNGNLLLSVPQRGDGTIDEKERRILEEIAAWMEVNSEGIYETRPWKIFGEGPVAEAVNPLQAQGFNEGRHAPYTPADIRFVTKGGALYAHVLAWPADGRVVIRSLAEGTQLWEKAVGSVTMAGHAAPLPFERTAEGLVVTLPDGPAPDAGSPGGISLLLRIS